MKVSNTTAYANIHSIETFGAFDGPGIRYVLFLQGCPFQCKYCHNRDTWSTGINQLMSADDVLKDYDKYSHFYKKGGLTVSGGEPLLQIPFLIDLFKKAKEKNIHTAIDTSAATFTPSKTALFNELMQYTDLVLLDIKHMDEKAHLDLTGSTNRQVLDFARYLDEMEIPVAIRHVLLPTINADEAHLKKLRSFLDTLSNVTAIDVLPYHTKGIMKWEQMGLIYPLKDLKEPTHEMIEMAETILKKDYAYLRK